MIAAAYRAAWAVEREPDTAARVVRTDEADAAPASAVKPATLRKRRSRAKQKSVPGQIEMFSDGVTSPCDTRDIARDRSQPQKEVPTPLRKTTSLRSVEDGGGGSAREAPLVLVTQEAFTIADEIGTIVGLDPEFTPPGWCGAAMQVQAWLAHWTHNEIIAGVRAGMAGKRDGPPESPRYFEKPIARVHLRLVKPMPKFDLETTYVRAAGKTNRNLEVLDDIAAGLATKCSA